jgi:hypothetical protein
LVGQLLDKMVKGTRPDRRKAKAIDARPTWDEAFKRHQKHIRKLKDEGVYA